MNETMSSYAPIIIKNYVTKYPLPYREHCSKDAFFTKEECDKIIQFGYANGLKEKTTAKPNGELVTDIFEFNLKTSSIDFNNDTAFIYKKLSDIVNKWNTSLWNFNIIGFAEKLVFSEYSVDNYAGLLLSDSNGESMCRKLTIIFRLSDENNCEGGEISTCHGEISLKRGQVLMIPSFIPYSVRTVKKGKVSYGVIYVHGKPFC